MDLTYTFSLEKWFEGKVERVERMRQKEAGGELEKLPVPEGADAIAEMMERNQKMMYIRLWNPTLYEDNLPALADFDD